MKKYYLLIIGILISSALFSQNYSHVYLIGGATPNGWDNGKAQEMTLIESSPESAIFSWTGVLTQSDYKFINALSTWMPCFNAETANEVVVLGNTHKLVYNENNGNIDYKFKISEVGNYKVVVDLKKLTMVVTKEMQNDFENIWVTGSAVPNTTVKLTKGVVNSFIYGGELLTGDLKFMSTATPEANTKYFVPVLEDNDITGETSFVISDDPSALGWNVTVSDPLYKIKINTLSKISTAQIIDTNKKFYIVGGATSVGWEAANAIELVQDKQNKSVYIFDGELKIRTENVESNSFKLLGQLGWNPISLHPINANDPIIGASFYTESFNGSYADNKWIIDESQQGRYIIKINVMTEAIESLYVENATAENIVREDIPIQIRQTMSGIHIKMPENLSIEMVQIIDLEGRTIYSARNKGCEFDIVDSITKGVYVLKIECNRTISAQRILID